ncbi:alpha/beta hydrolase [Limnohabitans sp.]|uniref:alpha/beta hydrolase n=1 Tax=Limnohabitans sp. TaxID=1907725 RepID=UPI00286FA370|nr:alpha/beta hydrolase [Limnohabitans sp.]
MSHQPAEGPAPEVLAQLRSWGTHASMPEVKAFYSQRVAQQDRSGLELLADQPYGTHPRQRMDVYVPQAPGHNRPVLLFLHGGGFIRGDKADRANVGWWGARQGFVTVLANYRLAPEVQWPSGAEDVVAACQRVQALCSSFGADPRALVLAGESAGAAHVAAASLIRSFQPQSWNIAGAFLLSGPYDAQLERMARGTLGIPTPDPRNDAYFGTERPDWAAASIVECVDAAPFPIVVGTAERDLPQMQVQAGALFSRLVTRHGFQPDWLVLPEHNHFSAAAALGTEDPSLAKPLAEFVRSCAARSAAQA